MVSPQLGPSTVVTSHQPTNAEDELHKKLNEAVRQRDFQYKLVFVVTMSFETDDTDAHADSKAFSKAMKEMFNLPDANILEVVFPKDRDADSFWALHILAEIEQVKESCIGRKLLLLHFAGHGALDSSNQLLLQGNSTRFIQELPWDLVKMFLFNPYRVEHKGVLDVACILDCCYSGAFVTPNAPSDKIVEILAAADARSRTTVRKTKHIEATFTQRFIFEMRSMVANEDKAPITFPEILKRLQYRPRQPSKPSPVYSMICGDVPILLPVTSLQLPTVPHASTGPSNPLVIDSWRPQEHSVPLLSLMIQPERWSDGYIN
ncbi:hypothetical protein Dda_7547 [Drechslerella dactyloides]|uniref:Uncharacterized protein n=1 Tax=Drechslerella dactyloides TaxID=74499 RepID=A0AAD6ISK1_DREDA|nr:hypothetical protein Dda_7547 [Drechslerella dactyloides]